MSIGQYGCALDEASVTSRAYDELKLNENVSDCGPENVLLGLLTLTVQKILCAYFHHVQSLNELCRATSLHDPFRLFLSNQVFLQHCDS